MRLLIVTFICVMLAACGGGTTGINGDSNDGNQVAIGDGNIVGDDNRTFNDNRTVEAVDETPPDLEEDIPPISFSTDSYEKSGSGCGSLIEETAFVSDYIEKMADLTNPIVLQDENKVRTNFYVGDEVVSSAQRSWFPLIFVPGRKLRIQYYMCGNGPIRFLTYIEALKSED
jgi:hypothetical protein